LFSSVTHAPDYVKKTKSGAKVPVSLDLEDFPRTNCDVKLQESCHLKDFSSLGKWLCEYRNV